jgi:putative acetyltransferase/glycoprotease fusion protein
MIVRPAAIADLPALTRLETAFPARQRWSDAAWRAEIDGRDRLVEVADAGGVIACASWRHAGETTDLDRIIVAEEQRGRGVAGGLLKRGIAWAVQQRAGNVLLEVASDNTAALRLYTAAGFAPISRRRSYYGQDIDALVMELRLGIEEKQ